MHWKIHPPRPSRFPSGGDFAPLGPWEISWASGSVFSNTSLLSAVYGYNLSLPALLKYLQCTAKNSHRGFPQVFTGWGFENVVALKQRLHIGGQSSYHHSLLNLWCPRYGCKRKTEGSISKLMQPMLSKGPHLWLILCTSEYLIWDRTHFQTDSFWAIPYTISKLYQFKINTFHKPRFKLVRNIWIK